MRATRYGLIACVLAMTLDPVGAESAAAEYDLDIPRGSLTAALKELSLQTGTQLGYLPIQDHDAAMVTALQGRYTAEAALAELLAPNGLTYERINERLLAVLDPVAGTEGSSESTPRSSREDSGSPDPSLPPAPGPGARNASGPSSAVSRPIGSDVDVDGHPNGIITLEEIVVTGTHIRGAQPIGSHVTVVTREEIRASGHARIQDYLETVPQNFSGSAGEDASLEMGIANWSRGQGINLRGLGTSGTLVLINGRRQALGGAEGTFVDISSIASAAVERIEILTDGASALYGSDAVGGVVNFVLRKDYEGLETNVRLSNGHGDAQDVQVSQLMGRRWAGGNLLVGYQYMHRDPLMAADLFYASMGRDFRRLGGSDFREHHGSPGTILSPFTFQPAYAIPAGQDGTALTAADLIPGQVNYRDDVDGIEVLPGKELHMAFMNLNHEFDNGFGLLLEARYGRRHTDMASIRYPLIVSVPSSNPFHVNPFGAGPVWVSYNFGREMGISEVASDVDTYGVTLGGTMNLWADWRLQVAGTAGRETTDWNQFNTLSSSSAALQAALADPDPATALNVFGDAGRNDPATLDAIRRTHKIAGRSVLRSLDVIADGTLLGLPAGSAKLAVGASFREERLDAWTGTYLPATRELTRASFSVGELSRDVFAVFGEAAVPLVRGGVGLRSLDVVLAGRYEDYSDFGSTLNPKFGLDYVPLDGLKLRASWGTSFHAPRFNQLSPAANQPAAQAAPFPDPASPSGISEVLYLSGANDGLREERADTWTAGFDLVPTALPDLAVSATYFHLDYKGRIQPGGRGVLTLAFEDDWTEIIKRNPTPDEVQAICDSGMLVGACPLAPAAIIDARLRNMAQVRVRGVDLDVDLTRQTRHGRFHFGLSGTYTLDYDEMVSSSSAPADVLDTVGNVPSLRLRGRAGWSRGAWGLNGVVNHVGDYRDVSQPVTRKVDAWTTVDFSLSYLLFDKGRHAGSSIQLSASNLFDKEPPFVNQFWGFDPANASQTGRSVGLDLNVRW